MSRKVTIRKFKMLYFRNEGHHGTAYLQKDLFLSLLQLHIDKKSEYLATLILEFDDVTKKPSIQRKSNLQSNGAFSHDVTAAILVFQNKETAAMLVYQTKPLGIELHFHANFSFCCMKLT